MNRIEREKQVVGLMVKLYCRRKEGNRKLCPGCQALLTYAHSRLEHCPSGERKTACKHCRIHCYQPEMRERMRQVMRFAGPRMMVYHPLIALRHLLGKD